MKFGGFYERQFPRPWARDSEHKLLKDALGQVEPADRLRFDYVRATEQVRSRLREFEELGVDQLIFLAE